MSEGQKICHFDCPPLSLASERIQFDSLNCYKGYGRKKSSIALRNECRF